MSLTIAEEYKYSLLQMAAEALLVSRDGTPLAGPDLINALRVGNDHNSVFTEAEAT